MSDGRDHLSNAEIGKDALQDGFEATVHAVGHATGVVIDAVGEVAKTLGGLATELFEISDAARRARADNAAGGDTDVPDDVG
ncbi:MAG: hypothetical protein FWE71_08495 [Nocardioidaceae bacterium]|nr:hypothetical protein [Nocardioidaceae bacterium]MCL2613543.1 hypothetical protein [Nocardioidaceae bacterium]